MNRCLKPVNDFFATSPEDVICGIIDVDESFDFYAFLFCFNCWKSSSIVGASGAIMAILVATATYSPFINLRLLLIGNVKLWQFTFVILLLDLIQIFVENQSERISKSVFATFFIFFQMNMYYKV